jgi:hypothetical protein
MAAVDDATAFVDQEDGVTVKIVLRIDIYTRRRLHGFDRGEVTDVASGSSE